MIQKLESPVEAMTTRVIVADDHALVRSGVRSVLEPFDMKIVAEAETIDELFTVVDQHEADAVLLDVRFGDSNGLANIAAIKSRQPGLAVLIYSAFDNPTLVASAIMHGASGFLLKSASGLDLARAIETVRRGETIWGDNRIRRRIGSMTSMNNQAKFEVSLTRRESEVLEQLASGLSNAQIGDRLDIGYETVKEHMKHILRKVGVSDRTQAAVWAVRNGIL